MQRPYAETLVRERTNGKNLRNGHVETVSEHSRFSYQCAFDLAHPLVRLTLAPTPTSRPLERTVVGQRDVACNAAPPYPRPLHKCRFFELYRVEMRQNAPDIPPPRWGSVLIPKNRALRKKKPTLVNPRPPSCGGAGAASPRRTR